MPQKYQPSPEEVAILTLHLIEAQETEESGKWDYARISRATLRRISLRVKLEGEGFVEKWIAGLAELGWSAFHVGDEYGLMRSNVVVETWPTPAPSRIRSTLVALRRGDRSPIDELREQLFYALPEFEEDE